MLLNQTRSFEKSFCNKQKRVNSPNMDNPPHPNNNDNDSNEGLFYLSIAEVIHHQTKSPE